VSEEEEMLGLDLAEMGMEAYPSPHEREGAGQEAPPASSLAAGALEPQRG